MAAPLRLAALISGGGRTLLNLADRIDDRTLPASIELVISSRPDAAGVERARARGLEVRIADEREVGGDEDAVHDAVSLWLREMNVDLVCLCGYLRWMRVDIDLAGRVINIHPALLPDFGGAGMYGLRVHRAVLEAGAPISGCTVHFVDEVYDHGPVVLQRVCPVMPDDDAETLAARVFEQECIAYPEAIRLFAARRIELRNDQVMILPKSSDDS